MTTNYISIPNTFSSINPATLGTVNGVPVIDLSTLDDNFTALSEALSTGDFPSSPFEGMFHLHSDGAIYVYTSGSWSCRTHPTGTKSLFYQNTAPTGWSIDTSMNDKLVFVTKGSAAGGQTGGGAHSSGTWTISGISGSAHAHSQSDHQHDIPVGMNNSGTALKTAGLTSRPTFGSLSAISLSATGPDTIHAFQSISGTTTAVNTGSASESISSNGAWRPAAYCYICCSKS